jgi:protein N-terminal methyltransferase
MEKIKEYEKIKNHWKEQESSIKGVLNGFEDLNKPDIEFSIKLLNYLKEKKIIKNNKKALDCASGIGRVTELVLINFYDKIDLFEQEDNFINKMKDKFFNNNQIGLIEKNTLQNFKFDCNYDLIWIQWCLENLNKNDIVSFLLKCKNNLNQNGIIIIKENCLLRKKKFLANDLSIQRNEKFYLSIFKKCKFKIIKKGKNENWPKEFIPLNYFILSNI